MAKKKIEPITSLGSEDRLTVQKSLPLFALWRSDLTLAEFKILDTYLARIDSHHPEKRQVIFEKGELEEKLGVKKINNKDLKARLKHLMGNVIEIPDTSVKKGFKFVTLFEEAVAEQDDYGLWKIKMECTQKAMKYIFNIENLGYLRYKLRCVTSITSRYSYIMFIYLEANRYRKSWEVELTELKKILACDEVETYSAFKEFNKQVLKRVQKEMHEKTECRFTYEPIKKGRVVRSIRFTMETLPAVEPKSVDYNQISLNFHNDHIEFLRSACAPSGNDSEPEFSRAEMQQLYEIIVCIPDYKFPYDTTTGTDSIAMRQYHYLSMCYAKMNRIAEKTKIKNRLAYLSKILQEEAKIESSTV